MMGGALLAIPLTITQVNPISIFIVFTLWGFLREQAQKNDRGRSFKENWIGIWNVPKLIEGVSWGVGAALLTLVLN